MAGSAGTATSFASHLRVGAALALFALPVLGCVERGGTASDEEEVPLSALISRDAPTPKRRLSILFEDKVELVGYDIAPTRVAPGETLRITWYWKALRAVDAGFRIFTHVEDENGERVANLDETGALRQQYPPDRWRSSEHLRDPQVFTVPREFKGSKLVFHVGLWNGPVRMEIARGPNDESRRARAAEIAVRQPGAQDEPEVPTLIVRRASGIEIDGRLDEPEWRGAAKTHAFVETMQGGRAPFHAEARMLYDDRYLYVAYEVNDRLLLSPFRNHDDHLWEQDCVELFLDPNGDGRSYFEIQISPRGVTFDTRYVSRRVPRPFGHVDWESHVEAKVVTRGRVDDDEEDHGYVVEARIPFLSLGVSSPEPGSTFRANMYVMDRQRDGIRASAWSPPLVGDFHVPARFGRLEFE